MAARPRTASARGTRSGGPGSSGTGTVLKFRNRRITIMRGTGVNDCGDLDDTGVVYAAHIPAALAETEEETFDRASQARRTIRTITLEFDHWVDVTSDDTLMDEFTGYFYLIESIKERPGIGIYPPAKILTLRMRSGVTVASDG